MSDATLFDDLFLPDTAATYSEGLICLRDAVPEALRIVVELSWWRETDERNPGKSGNWAYLACRKGVYFERTDTWGGWDCRPRNLLPWADLARLVGDDPRRRAVVDWVGSLTMPDRWKDIYRPYELWPNPGSWNPDYLEIDRSRPGYEDRMRAWSTVQQILTEAAS